MERKVVRVFVTLKSELQKKIRGARALKAIIEKADVRDLLFELPPEEQEEIQQLGSEMAKTHLDLQLSISEISQ
jgi:hypothetical protein